MVGAEDGYQVRVGLLDKVDVLKDGVGRSLIPGFVGGAHLRRHRDDELVFEQAAELPALAQVLQERLAAELGQHVDRIDTRVDKVAEYEIDDAVFATERDRGFGALLGEGIEPCTLPSGQHDAQHAQLHTAGYCVSRVWGYAR